MTDTRDLGDYKQGIAGTISGFDSIEFASDPTLSETNESVSVLAAKMRDLVSFYGPEHVRQLTRMFMAHKTDYNNPHRDTVSNLTDGDIGEVFQRFLPGTPPAIPPDFVVDAFLEMGAPFSNMTVLRNSEMNVIDQQGYLAYCGPNEIGIDWSEGIPLIPCWPSVSELIGNTDYTTNSYYSINGLTAVSSTDASLVPWMFGKQITLLEQAGQRQSNISYSKANVQTVGKVYTHSFFLYLTTHPTGTIYIDADRAHAFLDVTDLTRNFSTPGTQLYVKPLANGWYRIGITYTAQLSHANFTVGYEPHTYDSYDDAVAGIALQNRVYIGVEGYPAFTVFGPNQVDVPGLPPFIQSGSLSSSVVSTPGPYGSIPLSRFMFALRGVLYGNVGRTTTDTLLKVDGNLQINVQGTQLNYLVEAITPSLGIIGSLSSGDAFHCALSCSSSMVSLLSTVDARKDISSFGSGATYTGGSTISTISFGPFCGGIRAIQHYAVADDLKSLEYLVN